MNLEIADVQNSHVVRIMPQNLKHIPNFQKFTLAAALAGVLMPPYIPTGPAER